jgi:hypothetical protein
MIFSYRKISAGYFLFNHHCVELAYRGADTAALVQRSISITWGSRLLPLIASLVQLRMHTMQPSHCSAIMV